MNQMTLYTPQQEKQVTDLVDEFANLIGWLKTPEGIEMMADKGTDFDGDISQKYFCQLMILYAMDMLEDRGAGPEEMHNRVAGAVLQWSGQSVDQDMRDSLRPIFKHYLSV